LFVVQLGTFFLKTDIFETFIFFIYATELHAKVCILPYRLQNSTVH